jgi:hypothetical protein
VASLLLCDGCLPQGLEVLTGPGWIGPETRVCSNCGDVPTKPLNRVALAVLLRAAAKPEVRAHG